MSVLFARDTRIFSKRRGNWGVLGGLRPPKTPRFIEKTQILWQQIWMIASNVHFTLC